MTKPDIQIPASFAIDGIKTDFDNTKIQNGFDRLQPDVLAGDNLNKLIDDTYKGLNGVLDLYKGVVLYDEDETYSNKSIIFNINEDDEIKIYRSLVNNNIGNDLDDTDYWQEVSLDGGGGMPIGSYITVNCTASYVPNGCLPCDGTEYSKAQFTDLWTNYLTGDSPKLLTCSYTEYNNDIVAYGQCNKFAIDTVNETFKVPTIKDGAYITQALSDIELGKSYNESLPNIRGAIDNTAGSIGITACSVGANHYSGALFGSSFSGRRYSNEASSEAAKKVEINASLSSPTYQDNAKVQGDNVRARIFVVVATGSINQSQMDWAQWASNLQGKLNTDHTNDSKPYIKTTYTSGTSGYRIWSDGYCVQWGDIPKSTSSITYLKNFADTNYVLSFVEIEDTASATFYGFILRTNGFTCASQGSWVRRWQASGYLATGQY